MDAVVTLVLLAMVVLLAMFLATGSFFMVEQAQVAMIERFGRFDRIARAGLNSKIPLIERRAGRLSMRVQQLNVKIETKTQRQRLCRYRRLGAVPRRRGQGVRGVLQADQPRAADHRPCLRRGTFAGAGDDARPRVREKERHRGRGQHRAEGQDQRVRLRHRRLAGDRYSARRKGARGDERDQRRQPPARSRRTAGRSRQDQDRQGRRSRKGKQEIAGRRHRRRAHRDRRGHQNSVAALSSSRKAAFRPRRRCVR